jgi:hypothetical protein
MRANDIILSVRSIIRDEDIKKKISDEELIDSINSALSAIAEDLNPWDDGEWIITPTHDKSRYELPPYFFSLSSVFINGKRLAKEAILGYKTFKDCDNPHTTIVSTSINNFHIKPTLFNEKKRMLLEELKKEKDLTKKAQLKKEYDEMPDDMIKVFYDREEQIAYKEDIINLPDRFRDAIVFYVLHLAQLHPIRKDGDAKSLTYLQLFERRIEKLKSSVYRNKHSKRIKSPYIKV